jgi:uncharacterized protein (DUF433 family)
MDRIVQNPEIMVGKPVVRGTRIPVELVLGQLAANLDLDELFAGYPGLTIADVKAVLAFAQRSVEADYRRSRRRTARTADKV